MGSSGAILIFIFFSSEFLTESKCAIQRTAKPPPHRTSVDNKVTERLKHDLQELHEANATLQKLNDGMSMCSNNKTPHSSPP